MGGFCCIIKKRGAAATLALTRAQFAASGFSDPITIESEAWAIDYYPQLLDGTQNIIRYTDDDFIIAVGTFLYGGRIGADAARLFYDEPDHSTALRQARGHFVLIISKNGKTSLFRDFLGSYEVFLTPDSSCITTSFLAAAVTASTRTIEAQAVYEYVFNGVSLGTATPFTEVRRLDLEESVSFGRTASIIQRPIEVCPKETSLSLSAVVECNVEGLIQYARILANLFGDNIQMALSGGYDSRFLLALFRRVGVTPHLFVYGPPGSEDVRIAQEIAAAEGIALQHIDKNQLCSVNPVSYAHIIEANFFKEDALPWGGIFSNGAELIARSQRNKGGALHVNGGGGEVFRNFFYLLDRPISLRAFVWTFFSQYDPGECTSMFDVRSYEDAIIAKISGLLKITHPTVTRREVECLYPYFRYRSWFGRENSVNSRWGYSVLPFFDHNTVTEALRIPIRYKHFGNLESAMIRTVDPALAGYRTNYGHNFERNAPFRTVLSSLLTYWRPPPLRRYSFRLKRMLNGSQPRSELLSPYFLGQVIDMRFPFMSKFFQIERVTSEDQFARICTLEYLFRRMPAEFQR